MTLHAQEAAPASHICPLIGPGDPPPFTVVNTHGTAPILLVCDHASAAIPRSLGHLGLPAAALERHIAIDIGAAEVTRGLGRRFEATAVLAGYSRLIVDLNRHPDDPTAFRAESDGQRVPGNEGLTLGDRELRLASFFRPYHDRIDELVDAYLDRGVVPAFISVHSFTPKMDDVWRPWHVGVLWDVDPRIPVPLIDRLRGRPEIYVGDNEPYSGRHPSDYTVDRHAERVGLPHVCLEIRQDLLGSPAGIELWVDILATALEPILADPGLYRLWHDVRREQG